MSYVKHVISAAAAMAATASSLAVQAQSTTTYAYDSLGRVTETQDGVGAKSTYQLDTAGNRQQVAVHRQFDIKWEAESLPHQNGFADRDGWAASVQTPSSYITYGPYATDIPAGHRVGTWRMAIDVHNASDGVIANMDVWDATAGQLLASRSVSRHEWHADDSYQIFELPFDVGAAQAGHAIELRTFYIGASYIRIDKIGYY